MVSGEELSFDAPPHLAAFCFYAAFSSSSVTFAGSRVLTRNGSRKFLRNPFRNLTECSQAAVKIRDGDAQIFI